MDCTLANDLRGSRTAGEEQVKSGEIGEKGTVKLWIDGWMGQEGAKFCSVLAECVLVQVLARRPLGEKNSGLQLPADFHRQSRLPRRHSQFRKKYDSDGKTKDVEQVSDNRKVEVEEILVLRGKESFKKAEVFL